MGFGIVWGPILPLELIQQLQGKDMTLKEIETEVKAEVVKFEGWIKTLELKFFKGKLHQKVEMGHPPTHAWIPVESHDSDAPAPGEPIVTAVTEEHEQSAGDSSTVLGTSTGTST
jgi:hypothetical protein